MGIQSPADARLVVIDTPAQQCTAQTPSGNTTIRCPRSSEQAVHSRSQLWQAAALQLLSVRTWRMMNDERKLWAGLPPPARRPQLPRIITFQRKASNRRVVNEDRLIAMLQGFGEVLPTFQQA